MRLERLTVGAFGALRPGLRLEFGPGLNVVAAPNEAGKSTLAELITSLLYGFGKRKAGVHPYEPWQGGGEPGGELVYRLDDGREFTLRRYLTRRGEQLSLIDEAGREVDLGKAQPGQKHLGCSRGVFLTVARMDLDDLGDAFGGAPGKERQQSERQLLGFFYQEAATKGQTANPVKVIANWRGASASLYSRDGRKGRADQDLLAQIDAARQELHQARQREEQAAADQAQLKEAEQALAELTRQRKQAGDEQRGAQERLQRAADAARLAEIKAEIDQLTAAGLADEDLHNRALALAKEAEEAGQAARQAEERQGQEDQRLAQLTAGRPLAEMEGALDGLARRWAEHQVRQADLARRQDRERDAARELAERWQTQPEKLAVLDVAKAYRLPQVTADLQRAGEESARLDHEMGGFRETTSGGQDIIDAVAMVASGLLLVLWAALTTVGWWPALAGAGLGLGGLFILGRWLMRDRGHQQAWLERRQQLGQEIARLQEERAALMRELGETLAQADPPDLAAARAEASALLSDRAETQRGLAEAQARLAGLQEELAAWGWDGGGDPEQGLSLARQRCRQAAAASQERDRSAALAQEQRRGQEHSQAELGRLLGSHGFGDLAALVEARERHRRVVELKAKAEEAESRLAASGQEPVLSVAQAEQGLAAANAKLEQVNQAIRQAEGLRGELRTSIKHLLAGQSAAAARAGLERLEQRRHQLAKRYDTLLLAGELLDRAMDHYRLEAQPSLLQRAAGYLRRATNGSYTWLGADLFEGLPGKKPELSARRSKSEMDREAGVLSRGTRDQLYLCLKLALADEVSQGRESLPLILDDPLVNFDDKRLEGALSLLDRLAGERQVIFLTCHLATAERAWGLPSVVRLGLE